MRKLITTLATAGVLSLAAISATNAAPVPGFEGAYAATFAACTLPAGSVAACETALNAQVDAQIAAGVPQDVALVSFTALRAEVLAANAGDPTFQAAIEAVFEGLLPDSGAIPGGASPTTP